MIKRLLISVLVLLVALANNQSFAVEQANATKSTQQNEKETPTSYQGNDWTLTNLAGEKVQLSQFQGKPVILVFWATWCPYCKKLLPGIEALNVKYAKHGLTILAVNIKEDWQPKTYWRNHEYTFDALLEGDDVATSYGIFGTPGIIFIAPSGKVLKATNFSDPNHPSLEKFAQHFLKKN